METATSLNSPIEEISNPNIVNNLNTILQMPPPRGTIVKSLWTWEERTGEEEVEETLEGTIDSPINKGGSNQTSKGPI